MMMMMKLLKMLILCGVATGLAVSVNAMTHMTQKPGQGIANSLAAAAKETFDLHCKYRTLYESYCQHQGNGNDTDLAQTEHKKSIDEMNKILAHLESMLGLINPNITVIFDGLDNQSLLNLLVQIGAIELIKKLVDRGAVVTIEDVSYADAILIKGFTCYDISCETRREIYYFLLNKLPEDARREFLSQPVQESATVN